jgi:PAS domain S-box-containing protein
LNFRAIYKKLLFLRIEPFLKPDLLRGNPEIGNNPFDLPNGFDMGAKPTYEELESIIDNAGVWLSVFDENGKVFLWNRAAEAISGYLRSQVVGRKEIWKDLFPDKRDRKKIYARVAAVVYKNEAIDDIETPIQCQNGSRRFLAWHLKNLVARDGKRIGTLCLGRDITETYRHQAQLQQAQKMEAVGALAGGIAHDFNNILGAIVGYAQLARMASPKDTKPRSYLGEILKACERAKELVQQILSFSRQKRVPKISCDLGLLVKEALNMIQFTIPPGIELRQLIPSNLKAVMVNQNQIRQIVINLCTNAVQAIQKNSERGRIEVTLEAVSIAKKSGADYPELMGGDYLKLSFGDDGCGMDFKILERIFDPYFTTKEVGKGTGMGLATIHGIVKDHGGTIHVESAIDGGSLFELFFPVDSKATSEEHRTKDLLPRGAERILVVDDEKPLADIGAQMLMELGYKVEVRTSAYEALEAFKAKIDQFDLVITDMNMPGMNGERLAHEIARVRGDIPILICSGFGSLSQTSKGTPANIKGILMKPLTIKDLATNVHKILNPSPPKGEE